MVTGGNDGIEPLRSGPSLEPGAFAQVVRRTIFDCCKWDPQMEDVSVLCPFPLLLSWPTWEALAGWAESLAAEAIAAEHELAGRADLHRRLGLSWAVRRALRRVARVGLPAEVARVMRFDFHLAREGWRISEVNSDVPGGFIEASGFTRLMADRFPDAQITADPARLLADTLLRRLGAGATVGLVHATAYTDDRQVMVYLARHLEQCGLCPCLISPAQLQWMGGRAQIHSDWRQGPADALIRFFPAEWLPNLSRSSQWRVFFAGAQTPLCNPATALLTQSKRFPLVWDELASRLPTWRQLLPETRDPRRVRPGERDEWVLKPAMGRVGEGIGLRGVTNAKQWTTITRSAWWHPQRWAIQRRFAAVPVETDQGSVYPCVGVFTVDGKAAGVYGRVSDRPLIDERARDAAVLVVRDSVKQQREVASYGPAELQRMAV